MTIATNERDIPATSKQCALLARMGYTGNLNALTVAKASEAIDKLKPLFESMIADAKRKAETIDLIAVAGERVALHKESVKEFSGPCPKCGGDDRFHVRREWFFCRHCHPDHGDAIEYNAWIGGKDFLTVCREIANVLPVPAMPTTPLRQAQPKATSTPAEEWRRTAEAIAKDANHRLFTDAYAESGREYLLGRGIEPHCWNRFNLGFRFDVPLPGSDVATAPAIVMPWYRGGKVWAIRYRFLKMQEYKDKEGKVKTAKQTAQFGSIFSGGVYGGQVLPNYTFMKVEHSEGKRIEALRTLIICEGEINAISIWQVTHDWSWDTISLGSESAKLSQYAIEYAQHFGRVLVWMDRSEIVKNLMSLIPGAVGTSSPSEGDANDLLQKGLLGGFLAAVRLRSCKTPDERKRFYFDLWDADQLPGGLDSGAKQIMASI